MDNDEYRAAGAATRPVLSRRMRAGIASVELVLVGLIAVLLADFVLDTLAVEPQRQPLSLATQSAAPATDTSLLLSFDPFFRDAVAPDERTESQLPESILNIQVFGLRARTDGSGSAIIKVQDGDQRLAQVGDTIATGVQLTAVYPDRLELRRAGVKEAVYLRPQLERAVKKQPLPVTAPQKSAERREETIGLGLSSLALTPVRRDRRIIGFRLPDALPALLLASGLEGGDVLVRANGSPLSSFERLQEIGEGLSANSSLALQIERRGQMRDVTVNLEGNR